MATDGAETQSLNVEICEIKRERNVRERERERERESLCVRYKLSILLLGGDRDTQNARLLLSNRRSLSRRRRNIQF